MNSFEPSQPYIQSQYQLFPSQEAVQSVVYPPHKPLGLPNPSLFQQEFKKNYFHSNQIPSPTNPTNQSRVVSPLSQRITPSWANQQPNEPQAITPKMLTVKANNGMSYQFSYQFIIATNGHLPKLLVWTGHSGNNSATYEILLFSPDESQAHIENDFPLESFISRIGSKFQADAECPFPRSILASDGFSTYLLSLMGDSSRKIAQAKHNFATFDPIEFSVFGLNQIRLKLVKEAPRPQEATYAAPLQDEAKNPCDLPKISSAIEPELHKYQNEKVFITQSEIISKAEKIKRDILDELPLSSSPSYDVIFQKTCMVECKKSQKTAKVTYQLFIENETPKLEIRAQTIGYNISTSILYEGAAFLSETKEPASPWNEYDFPHYIIINRIVKQYLFNRQFPAKYAAHPIQGIYYKFQKPGAISRKCKKGFTPVDNRGIDNLSSS